MELLILLIAFVVLDVAVYLWGVDTRDGKDWQCLGNPRRGGSGPETTLSRRSGSLRRGRPPARRVPNGPAAAAHRLVSLNSRSEATGRIQEVAK
jgi:hypothetical protein